MITIQQAMHAAQGHHQAGRFAQAKSIYRQILRVFPGHADALHLLGVLAGQTGDNGMAKELINQAITANPSNPLYCYNLGTILKAAGSLEEAAFFFRGAISIKPDYAEAYCNLGVVLREMGKFDEAVASFSMWRSINPNDADAHYSLGAVLQMQGRLDEAVTAFRQVFRINPNYAEAYYNLGIIYIEQNKLDDAVICFHRAISIKPDYPEAYIDLGVALQSQGKLNDAVASYSMAISIKPDCAVAHSNLGLAFLHLGKLDEAIASCLRTISNKPSAKSYGNLLYLHAFSRIISPESECALAIQWEVAALNEEERRQAHERKFDNPPRAGRKLRIGVVSAEIGQHSVAEFLEPFLEHLDHGRFYIAIYPTIEKADSRSARMRSLVDKVTSLAGCSDSHAAERIRSDRIDILIDTTAHTDSGRLGIFAHRAAPVQCHYIGYHGTTGLTEMDWFIADEVLLPASCDTHFREGIWRLPHLWVTYRGDASLPESNWRPNSDGSIRLGSFNNLAKIREETLALWAKVMNALPESTLLLKYSPPLENDVRQRICSELNRHGIGDARIEFVTRTPDWSSHMVLYDRIDIALDTIPLNSGTTAYDALWMGVPLVALEGDWMGGRMTTSILTALGKPEWIAGSPEEYVEIVVGLARDVAGRSELRGRQRQLMAASQLCDGLGMARALEDAFEAMFDHWDTRQESCRARREEVKAVAGNFEEMPEWTISIQQSLQSALEHHQAGRLPEAESIYENILKIEPDNPEALHLSGALANQTGQTERAVDLISRAIKANPSNPYYNYNLATILYKQGRLKDAEALFNRAISINPGYVDARYNLGLTLLDMNRLDEALASFRTTLLLEPASAESYYNIGIILRQGNRIDEAVDNFRMALKLKPSLVKAHSDLLLGLNYVAGLSNAEVHAEHMRYGEIFETPLRSEWQRHENTLEPDRRLRVGYVSGDFRRHVVAVFLEPVLMRHDHERYEIFCYSTFSQEDEVTARLRDCADVWRSVAGLADDEISRLIREDGIDILVDLAGHTAHNRPLVFARKPAPVQVSWLGYLATTGLRSIDYRIVDGYTDPLKMSEQYYSEALWRLPDGYLTYQPPLAAPPVRALPALANGFVTFGSFNNLNKVTAPVLALWSDVLKAVPGSRLLLKATGLEKENCREGVKNAFAAHGIGEAQLLLRGMDEDYLQHLDRYGEVDIALDPFPCNSGTTACEGLWMGVPIITLAGDRFISRMCMSIVCNAGLAEWVARTPEEYIALARKCSNDLQRLAALRAGLREQLSGSPLFGTERFTRNLEVAYRGMWRCYVDKSECRPHNSGP